MKPRILSLFSGLGGIDFGFEQAGFETVFATDIWGKSCESLSVNFPNTEVVQSSIDELDFDYIKNKYSGVDGVVGGPPCPPFSKSRFYRTEKQRGLDDVDGFMTVSSFFNVVENVKPKFFFFENVAGFVFKPHKSALEFLQSEASRLGYTISFKVLNAANFGVPQTRERFICIGVKKDLSEFIFPEESHSKNPKDKDLLPWVTCGDILSEIDYDLPEDEKMQAGSKHKHLLKQIPPGDNYLFFTEERGHPEPQFKWRSRYWSFLLKLSKDRPSWTIQASHSNNMGPFHWNNRFLRIQEIQRIQTFPENIYIPGIFKDQWRLIGNAVPPRLVNVLAKEIYKQYY